MFLLLFSSSSNLLLGFVPETVGLLLFGGVLIAVTVGVRWFFNESEEDKSNLENIETLAGEQIGKKV